MTEFVLFHLFIFHHYYSNYSFPIPPWLLTMPTLHLLIVITDC